MKSFHLALAGVVLAAAVAVFWARSDAQAPPPAPFARVAVCDMESLFEGYDRRSDLNDLFESRRKAAKAEDDKKVEQIKKLKGVLDSLNPNTKQYQAKLQELETLSLQRELWRQLQEQRFAREHRLLMQELYREVLAAVGDTARARRYDLILFRETVEIESKTTSELLNKIAQRKCLYANPAIDLTQPVLKRLNDRYRARRK